MNIQIICVGKLKEQYFRDACLEYSKRLSRYCKFSIVEIEEYKTPDNPSDAQIDATLINEGKRILEKIPKGSEIYAMCIEGKQLDSVQLSEQLKNSMIEGCSDISFIIGGSFGLSKEVKDKAKVKLSMSKMTFPHQLARVILCEQIYRCFNIQNGGKYHK